jgi:hypothetical protein
MKTEIRNYLEEVRSHLHLDPITERKILGEFYSHLKEKTKDLQHEGISPEHSVRGAIESFGHPRILARFMYEAYSKGSWTEALITIVPHFWAAALFFTHLWRHPVIAPAVFGSIIFITLLGWWHGKPNWVYSWVGYSLFPFLVGAFSSRQILIPSVTSILTGQGSLWNWISLMLVMSFYGLALLIAASATLGAARRDWILASVVIVPQPVLGLWLFSIERAGGFFTMSGSVLHQWDAVMGTVFTFLGIALVVFMRLRQRLLKAGALITIGITAGAFIARATWEKLNLFSLVVTSLALLAVLVSPSLFETRINHESRRKAENGEDEFFDHPSIIGNHY